MAQCSLNAESTPLRTRTFSRRQRGHPQRSRNPLISQDQLQLLPISAEMPVALHPDIESVACVQQCRISSWQLLSVWSSSGTDRVWYRVKKHALKMVIEHAGLPRRDVLVVLEPSVLSSSEAGLHLAISRPTQLRPTCGHFVWYRNKCHTTSSS